MILPTEHTTHIRAISEQADENKQTEPMGRPGGLPRYNIRCTQHPKDSSLHHKIDFDVYKFLQQMSRLTTWSSLDVSDPFPFLFDGDDMDGRSGVSVLSRFLEGIRVAGLRTQS